MTSRTRRTVINSLVVGVINFLNYLPMIALLILLMRRLGVDDFGKYSYVYSLGWIFQILGTLGTDAIIVRDLAQDKENCRKNAGAFILLRALVGTFSGLIYATLALREDPLFQTAMLFYAVGVALAGMFAAFQSVLVSRERFGFRGAVLLISSLSQLGLAAFLLWREVEWTWLVLAVHVIGMGIGTLLAGVLAYSQTGPWEWRVRKDHVQKLLGNGLIYGYFYILCNSASRTDEVILKSVRDASELGLLSAAKRLYDPMVVFLSAMLTEAMFPVISEIHASAPGLLRDAYRQIMRFSLLVIAPLSLFLIFFAAGVMNLVGSQEYAPAGGALQILAAFMIPANWHTVQVRFLFATRSERRVILPVTFRLALSILLGIWWASWWGYRGAAAAFGVAISVEMIWYAWEVRRLIGPWHPLQLFWRPALANGLFALVLFFASGLNLFLALLLAAGVYPVLLRLTGSLSWQEAIGLLKRSSREKSVGKKLGS